MKELRFMIISLREKKDLVWFLCLMAYQLLKKKKKKKKKRICKLRKFYNVIK